MWGKADALEDLGGAAVGDDDGVAGFGDDAGGFEFGGHASAAAAVAAVRMGADGVGDRGNDGDKDGGWVGGVPVVEAVDVGKEDEEVGVDVGHEERGELIVVAEDAFGRGCTGVACGLGGAVELEGGDGVVFVDDGDDAEGEEGVEGSAEVGVAGWVAEVVLGEKDLGDAAAEAIEGVVVDAHEAGLADGGAGLDLGEIGGAGGEVEALDAEADRAGGDDEDFVPEFAECGDGFDEAAEEAEGDAAIGAHNDVGAELDDDAAGQCSPGLSWGGIAELRIELLESQRNLLGREWDAMPSMLARVRLIC